MNIVLAVLILGGIILFHELGHFIFAKLSGIEVTEFSLGMGPRLLSFVKGETRYSLKLLPFGGSCAMLGEDEDAEGDRAFNNKPVFNRIAVVFGGPLFNFILAFLLSLVIVGCAGDHKSRPQSGPFLPGSFTLSYSPSSSGCDHYLETYR